MEIWYHNQMRKETYCLTQKEMDTLRIIDASLNGSITVGDAASLLSLSERQVYRLRKGVREKGASFIIHKNKGRKPAHATSDDVKQTIIELKLSEKYKDANFAHFVELLEEYEGITISYSALYRILTQAGIISTMKKRKRKKHHRRKRKEQEGLMLQIDASPHRWFNDIEASLHGAIDDATGKICALRLEKEECLKGYFETMEQIISREGIPLSFYSDRHTIFKSPKKDKPSIEQQLKGETINFTQFGNAMEELGVKIIYARSPQAKGRVERLWGTLQSRLLVEFKIHNITSFEKANEFLSNGFIDKFNKRFAVEPEDPESLFRPLDPNIDLAAVLCVKEERTVSDGSGFTFYGQYYQLIDNDKQAALPKGTKITVLNNHKHALRARYNGKIYDTKPLAEKPKKTAPKAKPTNIKRKPTRPADNHPWKRSQPTPGWVG